MNCAAHKEHQPISKISKFTTYCYGFPLLENAGQHSEIKTTQIYTHLSGQDLREAVKCLETR